LASDERRGLRASLIGRHRQVLGAGWDLRADVDAATDGNQTRDFVQDVLRSQRQYLRSTAILSRSRQDFYSGLDVTTFQDVRFGFSVDHPSLDVSSDLAERQLRYPNDNRTRIYGPNTFQRLPALTFAMMPRWLQAPFLVSMEAQFARWAPFRGLTGDEGFDGLYNEAWRDDPAQSNRLWEQGERAPYMRLDLHPKISLPLVFGNALRATPYAAIRQDTYFQESDGRWLARMYPTVGASVETELSRTFALTNGALRHTITPIVQVQYIPKAWGSAPLTPVDEVDMALPAGGAFEGLAVLRQSLVERREGAAFGIRRLRLDVGQGFDLLRKKPLDTFGRISFSWWRLEGALSGGYDPVRRLVSHVSTAARLNLPANAYVSAAYENLSTGGSDRLRRPIDLLVGVLADPLATLRGTDTVIVGTGVKLWSLLSLRYEARIEPRPDSAKVRSIQLQNPEYVTPGIFAQQTVGVGVSPACNCWSLEVNAMIQPNVPRPSWGLSFTFMDYAFAGTRI
jgi:LPS-assembly protein